MTIKRVKFEDIADLKGTTDKGEIDALTESDIKKGILKDADTPNLSDKDLEEFKELKRKVNHEKS